MKNVQAHNFAYSFAKQLEVWVQQTLFSDFTLNVKLDWSTSRVSSRGGMYKAGPGINIAMTPAFPITVPQMPYLFNEYPSYHADKDIGGFYALDPYLKLQAIIAHEVAHATQFHSYKVTGTRCQPHGAVFKNYYRMLRVRFINDYIPDQKELAQNYQNYLVVLKLRQRLFMPQALLRA
jgi:hypothetical protein